MPTIKQMQDRIRQLKQARDRKMGPQYKGSERDTQNKTDWYDVRIFKIQEEIKAARKAGKKR